jgi:hypothetical protein
MPERISEQRVYAQHVLGLLRPGHRVPDHLAHATEPSPLNGWQPADHDAMIEEGRRQSDRQQDDLERVRGRSQLLLALALALLAAVAALRGPVASGDEWWLWTVWIASLGAGAWSAVGAAAIAAVRADMEIIDAAVLSHYEPPVRPKLAADYAELVRPGENAVATRLTNFRVAVLWLLIAAVFGLAAWLGSQAADGGSGHHEPAWHSTPARLLEGKPGAGGPPPLIPRLP